LIEVETHAVVFEIDDVGDTAAVDIRQADALGIEQVGGVEPGRVVHRDLGAEATVAQVGPVTDFTVADAHEVGEAVARHVGEKDGFRAVGENHARPLFFVERLGDALRRGEASSASERCHTKASSSEMIRSAWPSPVRSTNLTLGSRHATFGVLANIRNGSQDESSVRS